MSEATTEQAKPTEAKSEAEESKTPEEKPLTVDGLMTCTSRFTRKAWNIFLEYKEDLDLIRFKRLNVTLHATDEEGASAIKQALEEVDATALSQKGKALTFKTTFEKLQSVIKHPKTHLVELTKTEEQVN